MFCSWYVFKKTLKKGEPTYLTPCPPTPDEVTQSHLNYLSDELKILRNDIAGDDMKHEKLTLTSIENKLKKLTEMKSLPNVANRLSKHEKHIRTKELESLELDLSDIKPLPKPDPKSMHDRWIIVTSIFGPNDDIAKLAAIPGWKLLVVGDKKTPKDWK